MDSADKPRNVGSGFSLLEVMIALSLSSMLFYFLVSQYLYDFKRHTTLLDGLHQASDTAFIVDTMRDSIRQAGFTPCVNLSHLWDIADVKIDNQRQILTVMRMSPQFSTITKQTPSAVEALGNGVFKPNMPVLLTNCISADRNRIQSTSGGVHNKQHLYLERPLTGAFSYIGAWWQEQFLIDIDKKTGVPALYYQEVGRLLKEKLSDAITGLHGYVHNKQIKICLDKKDKTTQCFTTRVRGS